MQTVFFRRIDFLDFFLGGIALRDFAHFGEVTFDHILVAEPCEAGDGLRLFVPTGPGGILQDGVVDQDRADEAGQGGFVPGQRGAVGGRECLQIRADFGGFDFALADLGHHGVVGLEGGTGAEGGHG